MMRGFAGSRMLASPDRTRAKEESICCCRARVSGSGAEGYFVARSRTLGNLLFFRTFLKHGDPKPGVESVKKLCESIRSPNPPIPGDEVRGYFRKAFNTLAPADFSAFEYVNHVIQASRPTRGPRYRGRLCLHWHREGQTLRARCPDEEDSDRGRGGWRCHARTAGLSVRIKEAFYYPGSAWCTPFIGGSTSSSRTVFACSTPYSFFFFYATGITPAMPRRWSAKARSMPWAFVDAKGNPWTAARLTSCICRPTSLRGFLVGARLRQPGRVHVADRPAIPERQQPDQGTQGESGRVRGCLFRPESSCRRREQLGADLAPAKAGTPSCASTARLSPGSTRLGGRERDRVGGSKRDQLSVIGDRLISDRLSVIGSQGCKQVIGNQSKETSDEHGKQENSCERLSGS